MAGIGCGPAPPPTHDSAPQCPAFLLQDVGVHVIAPAGELQREHLPHAVALLPLKEAAAAQQSPQGLQLPGGAGRLVVTIDGTESEAEVAALQVSS